MRQRATATVQAVGPRLRHGDRLVWPFAEDPWTAAWDAVHAAGLAPGTRVATEGLDPPPWWWQAAALERAEDAEWRLAALVGGPGPVVALWRGDRPDAEALAREALAAAAPLDDEDLARLEAARDEAARESDFPLGAYVAPGRHDEVLVARLGLGRGVVATWTTIAAGAAPSEFHRLQDAVGAYHSVLVHLDGGGRSVGLWDGEAPPEAGHAVRPVLRRLLYQQGRWRYGAWFAPA